MMRPKIVVTLDTGVTKRRGVSFDLLQLKTAYAQAVEKAGGTPILVAPTEDADVRREIIRLADAFVITGGDFDIDPTLFGEAPAEGVRVDPPKPGRTAFEWALTEFALATDRPLLGICGGMQLMNVVAGGSLHVHIPDAIAGAHEHEQPTSPALADHAVTLIDGRLAAMAGRRELMVNTTHHQAVARVGEGFEVEGVAPDGVVEAIAHAERRFAIGVQWHPELLADDFSHALYGTLVRTAR